MLLFSNKKASEHTEVSPRLVKHWTDRGLVYPEKIGLQQGSRHEYSYRNLFELRLISEFYQMGLIISRIKTIVEELNTRNLIKDWLNDETKFFQEEVGKGAYFNFFRDDQKDFVQKLDQAILEFCEYCYYKEKEYQSTLFLIDYGQDRDLPLILPSPYFRFKNDKGAKLGHALHYLFDRITKNRGIFVNLNFIKIKLDEKVSIK